MWTYVDGRCDVRLPRGPSSGSSRFHALGFLERGAVRVGAVLLLVLLGGVSCQRDEPATVPGEVRPAPADPSQMDAPGDSLTRILLELEPQVAPVMEEIQRARRDLRADSASLKADSAFVESFRELDATVREVVKGFHSPAFQALLWPEGAGAQLLRREDPERGGPAPEDWAMADSVMTFLAARGVWARRAEGSIDFAVNEAVLLEHWGPYLTPAVEEFLRQRVHEQVHPVAEDAGLMIPPSEVAARALWAERFLEVHEGSIVHDIVASRLGWYLAVFIGGLPNTRPFHTPTGVVDPNWRTSFETIASEHGGSAVGRVVSEYLALLERSDFTRSTETDAFLERMWDGVGWWPFP